MTYEVHESCPHCGMFVQMLPAGGKLKCPECGALTQTCRKCVTSFVRETSEGILSRPKRRV